VSLSTEGEMICYVDMEHPSALRGPHRRSEHAAYCDKIRRKLEDTSQVRCVVRPYQAVTKAWLESTAVRALVLGGNATDWGEYSQAELQELEEIIRGAELPILGLCGGLQLIGMAHGVPVEPMRPLRTGEADPEDGYAAGFFKEWGFTPVSVIEADPLFEGLTAPVFLEAHFCELREVPHGFSLLASTDTCRIQAIKRIGKPVYGTQFHPEAYIVGVDDAGGWLLNLVYPDGCRTNQPDGRTLLTNFFRLAGIQG
jgi:GMP synthase-like glutamine amidotransferase